MLWCQIIHCIVFTIFTSVLGHERISLLENSSSEAQKKHLSKKSILHDLREYKSQIIDVNNEITHNGLFF